MLRCVGVHELKFREDILDPCSPCKRFPSGVLGALFNEDTDCERGKQLRV